MIDFNDTDDEDEVTEIPSPQVTRKKMLLIILPIVIIIGLIVSFYTVFSNNQEPKNKNYQVLDTADTAATSSDNSRLVLYDLPEIAVTLKSHSKDREYATLKLNLEVPGLDEDQIHHLEALTPRINDIVTSHLIEIYPEEVQNAQGLYWLKEDLLYRINLVTKPIKISNINIKTFEIKGN